jgi:hypothetical protein
MKQGLKIVLFVLPQLFALCLKSNPVFSAVESSQKTSFSRKIGEHQLSNAVFVDDIKEFENEVEDEDDFSYFPYSLLLADFFLLDKKKAGFTGKVIDFHHFKLYILYRTLKLHCSIL